MQYHVPLKGKSLHIKENSGTFYGRFYDLPSEFFKHPNGLFLILRYIGDVLIVQFDSNIDDRSSFLIHSVVKYFPLEDCHERKFFKDEPVFNSFMILSAVMLSAPQP